MSTSGRRGRQFSPQEAEAGRQARRAAAKARALRVAPIVAQLRQDGFTTLSGLARALTDKGVPKVRGGSAWTASGVSRVMKWLSALDVDQRPK
jgi:hypothetical protein